MSLEIGTKTLNLDSRFHGNDNQETFLTAMNVYNKNWSICQIVKLNFKTRNISLIDHKQCIAATAPAVRRKTLRVFAALEIRRKRIHNG